MIRALEYDLGWDPKSDRCGITQTWSDFRFYEVYSVAIIRGGHRDWGLELPNMALAERPQIWSGFHLYGVYSVAIIRGVHRDQGSELSNTALGPNQEILEKKTSGFD